MNAKIYFTRNFVLGAIVILLLPLSACLQSREGSGQPVQVGNNQDVGITAIPVDKVRLEGLRFNVKGASLRSNSEPILDAAADILKSEPDKKVYVDVYNERHGSKNANLRLAKQRAENVKAYLEMQGIPSERMIARGFGATAGDSSQTHKQNSKVELIPFGNQNAPTNLAYLLSRKSSLN